MKQKLLVLLLSAIFASEARAQIDNVEETQIPVLTQDLYDEHVSPDGEWIAEYDTSYQGGGDVCRLHYRSNRINIVSNIEFTGNGKHTQHNGFFVRPTDSFPSEYFGDSVETVFFAASTLFGNRYWLATFKDFTSQVNPHSPSSLTFLRL